MFSGTNNQLNDSDAEISGDAAMKTSQVGGNTQWKGSIDGDELLRPGGMLLAALVKCAAERRQTMAEMAKRVGVTYGYVCQLRNGHRKVKSASDAFTLGCAFYLGVPHLTVLVMAGKVGEKDFYEMNELPARDLNSAMDLVVRDAKFGTLVTAEIRDGSVPTRYAFVRLYEEATGKRLLPERLDLQRILESVRSVDAIRQERISELKVIRDQKEAADKPSALSVSKH